MYSRAAEVQNGTNYWIKTATQNHFIGDLNITISPKLEAFS